MSVSPAMKMLRARYLNRALAPETLFLLNAKDALEYLDEAVSQGLVLAGVEGFLVTDSGAYQPSQDFSNDAADSVCSRNQFIEETRDLISRGANAGVHFQIVFEDEASS